MCSNRSDKETPLESSHKTNNRSGVQAVTPAQGWSRIRDEWTERLAAHRAMRDWCVSPAAGGIVLLNLGPCARACVCVCAPSHTRSCFIQYKGINIHSVEHDWQSVYFREDKWQNVYLSLSLCIYFSLRFVLDLRIHVNSNIFFYCLDNCQSLSKTQTCSMQLLIPFTQHHRSNRSCGSAYT